MQAEQMIMDNGKNQNHQNSYLKGQNLKLQQNKREEFAYSLRKNHRFEQHNKRRNIYQNTKNEKEKDINTFTQIEQDGMIYFIADNILNLNPALTNTKLSALEKVIQLRLMIQSSLNQSEKLDKSSVAFQCLQSVRKTISTEIEANFELISKSGMIEVFISFLDPKYPDDFIYEAAWALTNQTSSESKFVLEVLQKGALPILAFMANNTQNNEILEQCIWTLGNIAGDSPECRDLVIQNGGCLLFLRILQQFQGNIQLQRIAIWALSNIHRGIPEPNYQQVQHTIPVILQYANSQDNQIYISNSSEQGINQIIQSPQLHDMINVLGKQTKLEIITPALRTIGNLASSTDSNITERLLVNGVAERLASLLKVNKLQILKECLWTFSNIAAGDSAQIQYLFDENIFQNIFSLLHCSEAEQEAAYVICNTLNGANEIQYEYFVQNLNLIEELVSCLSDTKYVKFLCIILDSIESILEFGRSQQGNNLQGVNEMMDLFEQKGGLTKMETLYSEANEIISDRVHSILQQYFGFGEFSNEKEAEGISLEVPREGFHF